PAQSTAWKGRLTEVCWPATRSRAESSSSVRAVPMITPSRASSTAGELGRLPVSGSALPFTRVSTIAPPDASWVSVRVTPAGAGSPSWRGGWQLAGRSCWSTRLSCSALSAPAASDPASSLALSEPDPCAPRPTATGTTSATAASPPSAPAATRFGRRRARARRRTTSASRRGSAPCSRRSSVRSSSSVGTVALLRVGSGADGAGGLPQRWRAGAGPRTSRPQAVGGGAVVSESDRHLRKAIAQVALDRARADTERREAVIEPEVVVVAQHEAGALTRSELAQFLVQIQAQARRLVGGGQLLGHVLSRGDLAPAAHPPAAIEGGVEDRAPHVRLRARHREPVAQASEGAHEGVLHEVGRIVGAPGEQDRVAQQSVAALGDELRHDAFPRSLCHGILPSISSDAEHAQNVGMAPE